MKKIKSDHELALKLFDTGNYDAMYLAGLAVDPKKMTEAQLEQWAEAASWYMLAEYTVAWVTAESHYALKLARKWIQSDIEMIACAGWSTYANYVTYAGTDLDVVELRALLANIQNAIHDEPNRVRYDMNQFIICVGSYVPELREEAKRVAEIVGEVHVDIGNTACKVPLATEYIEKVLVRGEPKKKKTVRC